MKAKNGSNDLLSVTAYININDFVLFIKIEQ